MKAKLPKLLTALLLGWGTASLAQEDTADVCHCPCRAEKPSQLEIAQAPVSEDQLKGALSILKRACAQRNDCTAEEELQVVEKILFGVAESIYKDKEDQGYLKYLKSRISLGVRVLTGSYLNETPD